MRYRRPGMVGLLVGSVTLLLAARCSTRGLADAVDTQAPVYTAFHDPQRVAIRGYHGAAMEPFLTRDGRYLLFNNRNDPAVDTNLHYAERVDDRTFDYRGEIGGVNTPALEGVPTMAMDGTLCFVSTRSYGQTRSTLYCGSFSDGSVSDVALLSRVSRRRLGAVNFDVEISADGRTLYFVDGVFIGGPMPVAADVAIAVRQGNEFARAPNSDAILHAINTPALEYAAAISSDELELFFTRVDARPAIYRAARTRRDDPFGAPARLGAIDGFVEAPAVSADGRTLYYHRKEAGEFVIYRVTRATSSE